MIRKKIAEIISDACESCKKQAILPEDINVIPLVEVPREQGFGDYSTNIAFLLAPVLKKNPSEIARIFIQHINAKDICEKVEIAGKGFINFYLKDDVWRTLLKKISTDGIETLYPDVGKGKKVLIEFVSESHRPSPYRSREGCCCW
jgi:arginyl-tRNA synthetase